MSTPEEVWEQRRVAKRYVLEEILGAGGMGTVWRAHDELLGREVAVKAVEISEALPREERERVRARVLREARAAARLNHPGVVTIHDIVEEGGRVYVVMELVAAPTLTEVVRQHGPLPPVRAARVGRQLLDALEVAHGEGIVHRDVKPANVMLLPRDRVKLADFGIASVRGDPQLTSSGIVLGSPAFMAPEQAGGRPTGPPVDLWALGATLYYAVEGRVPFERDDQGAVLAAILAQQPDPMRSAGPLAPVIAGLLAKAPEDRPAGERLHRLLEQVAGGDGEPGAVPAPPPASRVAAATITEAAGVAPPTVAAAPVGPGGLPAPGGTEPRGRAPLVIGGFILASLLVVAIVVVALLPDLITSPSGSTGRGSGSGTSQPARTTAQATATTTPRAPGRDTSSAGNANGPVKLDLVKIPPPGQVLIDKFWRSATNRAGGYRIGVPSNLWQVIAQGPTTYAEWPGSGFGSAFEVHSYPRAQDPFEVLRRDAAAFAAQHKEDRYKLIRLTRRWTYRQRPASAWEYTWVLNGDVSHALVVGFRAGSHTYTVLYRMRELWWPGGGGTRNWQPGFEQAFTPL
jgi:hypothetical protein